MTASLKHESHMLSKDACQWYRSCKDGHDALVTQKHPSYQAIEPSCSKSRPCIISMSSCYTTLASDQAGFAGPWTQWLTSISQVQCVSASSEPHVLKSGLSTLSDCSSKTVCRLLRDLRALSRLCMRRRTSLVCSGVKAPPDGFSTGRIGRPALRRGWRWPAEALPPDMPCK